MARGYRKAAQFRLSGARKTGKIRVRDIAEFRVEIGIGIVFHEGRRGSIYHVLTGIGNRPLKVHAGISGFRPGRMRNICAFVAVAVRRRHSN
jgi:hypothetical protein